MASRFANRLDDVNAAMRQAWKTREARRAEEAGAGPSASPESPAQAWKRRYDALHSDTIQPVEIDINGEVERYHVRQLSVEDFDTMGACMARGGFTLWEFEDDEAQQSFYRALLFVGVCQESGARYFGSPDEAKAFYETRGPAAVVCLALRAALLKLNPYFVLPDAKKKTMTSSNTPASESAVPRATIAS